MAFSGAKLRAPRWAYTWTTFVPSTTGVGTPTYSADDALTDVSVDGAELGISLVTVLAQPPAAAAASRAPHSRR